ncbi:aminodeoxychorismate synthase, component I [Polymorphobacter glacialis]|uniref:Probable branched-chain-amino-acid aminotransferase n=1 Tax=Sandarakinorhabdus glacialis TaxID=1614636 RepID=A0A917E3G4_9SPHN|nr:chorismate-binding protein [Polymorphobacter glacialis]GGE00012.1 aminodeoxychorismate synthase, component I [Polymorphobacter glacialis]
MLLDDVAAGSARLFSGVVETVEAWMPEEVLGAVERLREVGPWAGFLGFEAGYALEPRLRGLARAAPAGEPLVWFGRFAREERVEAAALLGEGPAWVGAAEPGVSRGDYDARLARVLGLIAAGDIYQANLTFAAAVAVGGHPLHLYARLRAGSRAPYGALVFTGALWLLSFSPELFFRLEGRKLTAKPMKGTAVRGGDAVADAAAAAALRADPKNRAENLMIVDLLRNDLSRVGSGVAVTSLFEVETYPTVLQMTSTITAVADHGVVAADVLGRLFPCGSVTGAPKIRAMEVIAGVEGGARGAYTGSIGAISVGGDAVFNVAIRTLVIRPGRSWSADSPTPSPSLEEGRGVEGRLGLGSGIVADSEAGAEWGECLAKGAFLARRGVPDLIETMRCETGIVVDLERHLGRMAASAGFLGLVFELRAVRELVLGAVVGFSGRVRVLASPSGAICVQCSPLPAAVGEMVVAVARLPVAAGDWRLRHKTGDRGFYDAARWASGADEVVFVGVDGLVTEGSFTNVFVERGGRLVTPSLELGLLPGVLRGRLVEEGVAVESAVTVADLRHGFFVGNSLRGLMRARLRG